MHVRRAHLVAILATCLWMTACAYGITAHRHEPNAVADARYATFFVQQGESSGNTTVDRQLKVDIETELADKGLVAAPPEEAQAVVSCSTCSSAFEIEEEAIDSFDGRVVAH
jgi:hypothetical protein